MKTNFHTRPTEVWVFYPDQPARRLDAAELAEAERRYPDTGWELNASWLKKTIGCQFFDRTIVCEGHLWVDDLGYDQGLAANFEGTTLYRNRYGGNHAILGTVVLVVDPDYDGKPIEGLAELGAKARAAYRAATTGRVVVTGPEGRTELDALGFFAANPALIKRAAELDAEGSEGITENGYTVRRLA